jgi:hypothetical protein
MNFAINKIRYNKSAIHFLAKEGKKKYNVVANKRQFTSQRTPSGSRHNPEPDNDPFPSWKLIAILSGLGLYHHYQRVYK